MSLSRKISTIALLLGAALATFPGHANTGQMATGEVIGKHIFGLARDVQNDPVMIGAEPLIYKDSTSFDHLSVEESVFRLDVFDDSISSVYISDLEEANGKALDTKALSLSSVGGAHGATKLSKTYWNTLMFSENRVVDAAQSEGFVKEFKPYFKSNTELVKPYHYGWLNELIVLDAKGNAKAIKTYAAGRLFASSFVLMPDNKTAYLHDKQSGNLFVFIAEEANSMAKGVLYVVDGGRYASLIELGKSSALKMKFKLKKASFDKFFKHAKPDNGRCKNGYEYINTVYGEECLTVQKKNRKYLGQFEPIRASALKRVKPFLTGVEEIKFDRNKTEIVVVDNDVKEKRYSFKKSDEFGSDFIIQEL